MHLTYYDYVAEPEAKLAHTNDASTAPRKGENVRLDGHYWFVMHVEWELMDDDGSHEGRELTAHVYLGRAMNAGEQLRVP